MKRKISDQAPAFSLKNQNDKTVKLSDFKGQWLLIYFYPKDDTPGCTKEACAVRDTQTDFKKAGCNVVGISVDPVDKHQKFAGKYELNFDILADVYKTTVNAYGVWGKKKFMGREYMGTNRVSFLVDPDGKIAKIYEKVKPAEHAGEVLRDLKELLQ